MVTGDESLGTESHALFSDFERLKETIRSEAGEGGGGVAVGGGGGGLWGGNKAGSLGSRQQ